MIILIDIGNSRTKYTQLSNDTLSVTKQVNNQDFCDDYFVENFAAASEIVVANVANSNLTDALKNWCDLTKIKFTQVHSEQKKNQLTSAYQEPATLGIDRWLALVAATELYPKQSVLIIDAGTATTIDFVTGDGQHQGGWILAGIDALFNSILSHSTLVHAKYKTKASLVFGDNTTDNVNNACWTATLGMITQAIGQTTKYGCLDNIVLTGGNGKALSELLLMDKPYDVSENTNIHYIDNLIFYGLQQYCR